MRIIFMCCWSAVMVAFLFTSSDLIALLDHGALDIPITSNPDFAFFDIYEFRVDVVIQKTATLLI